MAFQRTHNKPAKGTGIRCRCWPPFAEPLSSTQKLSIEGRVFLMLETNRQKRRPNIVNRFDLCESSVAEYSNYLSRSQIPREYEWLIANAKFVGPQSISTDRLDGMMLSPEWLPSLYGDSMDLGGPYSPTPVWPEHFSDADLTRVRSGHHLSSFGVLIRDAVALEVVVDLACGDDYSQMDSWSVIFGGARYIGVDLEARNTLHKNLDTEVVYLRADLLKFMYDCEDNSVGLININGLERSSSGTDGWNYCQLLLKETIRVLKPEGVFICDDISKHLFALSSGDLELVFPSSDSIDSVLELPENRALQQRVLWRDFEIFKKRV